MTLEEVLADSSVLMECVLGCLAGLGVSIPGQANDPMLGECAPHRAGREGL